MGRQLALFGSTELRMRAKDIVRSAMWGFELRQKARQERRERRRKRGETDEVAGGGSLSFFDMTTDRELDRAVPDTGTTWMEENGLELRASIAEFLQAAGVRRKCSTGIHDRITYGYGPLDEYGFWRYPLADGECVRG